MEQSSGEKRVLFRSRSVSKIPMPANLNGETQQLTALILRPDRGSTRDGSFTGVARA